MDYVQAGAIAIHTLAMILVVRYYGILGRVILPALRGSLAGPALATTLVTVERGHGRCLCSRSACSWQPVRLCCLQTISPRGSATSSPRPGRR
jgi:hypothetical protein